MKSSSNPPLNWVTDAAVAGCGDRADTGDRSSRVARLNLGEVHDRSLRGVHEHAAFF